MEQQKIKEQREKLKQEDAIRRTEEEKKRVVESPDTRPSSGGTPTPPPEPKRDFTVATKVPGKDGFVFSPYNNKVIDVRGISTGTLVQDPTYPAAEKKYFRVP